MKPIIFVLCILLFAACEKPTESTGQKIVGQIILIGNHPFTILALRTTNEETFDLECDSTTDSMLRQNQGRIVEIVYFASYQGLERPVLVVSSAKILQ